MDIKIKKDITKSDQDGHGFIYDIDGREIEIQITDTAIQMKELNDDDLNDYITHIIMNVINGYEDDKTAVTKISVFAGDNKLEAKIILRKIIS